MNLSSKLVEADLLKMLQNRYTKIRPGTNADRYVRAQHVRRPTGYGHATAIADYLVRDTYSPFDLLGFEVKVSRSDWLSELRNPRKADWWKRHCNLWYLVVSDLSIVKDDLPEGWGLLAPRGGVLRVVKQSKYIQTPEPINNSTLASWGRAVAKTAVKEMQHEQTLRLPRPGDAQRFNRVRYDPARICENGSICD